MPVPRYNLKSSISYQYSELPPGKYTLTVDTLGSTTGRASTEFPEKIQSNLCYKQLYCKL